jgi:hypothetical protein
MLSRHQAEPCRELSAIAELVARGDAGSDGASGSAGRCRAWS